MLRRGRPCGEVEQYRPSISSARIGTGSEGEPYYFPIADLSTCLSSNRDAGPRAPTMASGAFLRFRKREDRADPSGTAASEKTTKSHSRHSSNPVNGDRYFLLTLNDVPAWRDPNPFVLTGYRRESRSCWVSLCSWGYWHNETCNIYSHLIPGVVLLASQGMMYDYVRGRHWDLESFDWAVLALQLFTAAFCFIVSAGYHTLVDHSPGVAHRWLQLDYVGIIVLILGNFISGLHLGFYCTPHLKYFYWSLVSTANSLQDMANEKIITLGLTTGVMLLSPKFRGPEWRLFRLGSFICTGLSAFAPIGHGWIRWGGVYVASIGVPYYLLEGLLLVTGCYFWEVSAQPT